MKLDMLIKSSCEEWSEEAQVPAGLADQVLRRTTRRRRSLGVALTAGSTAALVGAAAAIVSMAGPARHAPQPAIRPVPMSADTTLRTDLGNAFPRHLVAAGHTAVAAYYTVGWERSGDGPKTIRRTWFLHNPVSGTYEKTRWAYLDVAPGMHQAAVLEGPLPASRVGVLDMQTRKVTRWISVGHRVGGVAWSPEGRRLVMTTYTGNPDAGSTPLSSSRTGYYVVNAESGQGTFHPLPPDGDNANSRQDLGWSRSGTLLWAPTVRVPAKVFYDLNGHSRPAPAHEADTHPHEAGLSPNGKLLPKSGPAPGPAVTVTNVTTGKVAATLPIELARAWADDGQLFAIGCDPKKCEGVNEFRNRLLLVSLGGKITPLTGYQRSDQSGSWVPLFTHR